MIKAIGISAPASSLVTYGARSAAGAATEAGVEAGVFAAFGAVGGLAAGFFLLSTTPAGGKSEADAEAKLDADRRARMTSLPAKEVQTPATEKPGEIKKPEGIPDNWKEKETKGDGGKIYVNPDNTNDRVRVMPGDPESPYPHQQKPYVVDQNGSFRDVNGDPIPGDDARKTPEAHIPLSDFVFRR